MVLKYVAKNESISGSPSSFSGKIKPTQRSVLQSYSTRDITRVASSPIEIIFDA
jgi:hypothetical protein